MKKIAIILLALLTLASCFVLTSCNFTKPLCPDGCSFPFDENGNRERICENCGNTWCAVRGYHNWDVATGTCSWCGKYKCKVEGEHTYDISGNCTGCGTNICKEEGHKYDTATGKCVICEKGACKDGGHVYDKTTGKCTYCGKSSCKQGEHHYDRDGICTWCNKTQCQAEGHNYYEGYCRNCDKVSAFAWIYDIFDKPIETPDPTPPTEEEIEAQKKKDAFWKSVGEGVMLVGTMIAVTGISSLIYWLGCLFNWSWFVWIGHALMLLMTLGMFVAIHWIWGIVFFLLFDGAYITLICPMITQKTLGYNGIIH